MNARPQTWVKVRVGADGACSRRGFLRWLGVGSAGLAGLSWLDALTLQADQMRKARKACILLWMAGGPSQFETFDPKPGSPTQGTTRAIPTAVPGIQIAEHWTKTAGVTRELAVIRSVTSKEGNHGRATYLLHTGYAPSGGVVHPGFGSITAKELAPPDFDLPHFVSIQGVNQGPSFLGVQYAPFVVSDPNRPPDNLANLVPGDRLHRRLGLLKDLEGSFARTGAADQVRDHQTLYQQTAQMVLSPRVQAFNLDAEPEQVRSAYGRSSFGQGCLMARRLIETGVTFVEVQSSGWDTHGNELPTLKKLIPPVDQALAVLVADLKTRGLLENTLVIWMGEFGRTPQMNLTAGREHFPTAFNVVLAGGGVKGGQVIGATDKLGAEVTERPITVPDLFCTFCRSLGINPRQENQSDVGRPLKIVDGGTAVKEVFGS
ncbi:MAG: DUF1501 domain-containing protein [Planctomycetes bacterium]|nr:DUF1501 domain-containing protein [Planctomycetota bacterium]